MPGNGWREELVSGITTEEEERKWLYILHIPWNPWAQKSDQWVQVCVSCPAGRSADINLLFSWVTPAQGLSIEVNELEITINIIAVHHGLFSIWRLSCYIFHSHAPALQLSSLPSATCLFSVPSLCAWPRGTQLMSCPLACGMDLEAVLDVTPIHLWAPQTLFCCRDFAKHFEVSNQLRLSLFTLKIEKSFFLFR